MRNAQKNGILSHRVAIAWTILWPKKKENAVLFNGIFA